MYTDILRGIDGIGVFPVISLLLFVAVFSVVLGWAFRADGRRLGRIALLPLQDAAAAGECDRNDTPRSRG